MSLVYHQLSNNRLGGNSYVRKFLIVAFIGIHIPLLTLIFLLGFDIVEIDNTSLIVGIVVATLIATVVTMYVLKQLLWPLRQGTNALKFYFETGQVPEDLPLRYKDEAGQLLQLIQASIEKNHRNKEEQAFLTTLLSHDLRSPAAQTVTAARYIQEETNLEMIHQLAQLMEQSGQQMLEQMTNLVTMMRAGEEGMRLEPLTVNPIISGAVDQAKAIAGVKEIDIRYQNFVGANVRILGHSVLLQQAVYNLLTNATKFSFTGQTIEVTVSEQGKYLQLSVRDTGLGFDPAKKDQLFERFTRQSRKGTNGEASSGIGLYLIKRIATGFGGAVEARSEGEGKGAEFVLKLPLLD